MEKIKSDQKENEWTFKDLKITHEGLLRAPDGSEYVIQWCNPDTPNNPHAIIYDRDFTQLFARALEGLPVNTHSLSHLHLTDHGLEGVGEKPIPLRERLIFHNLHERLLPKFNEDRPKIGLFFQLLKVKLGKDVEIASLHPKPDYQTVYGPYYYPYSHSKEKIIDYMVKYIPLAPHELAGLNEWLDKPEIANAVGNYLLERSQAFQECRDRDLNQLQKRLESLPKKSAPIIEALAHYSSSQSKTAFISALGLLFLHTDSVILCFYQTQQLLCPQLPIEKDIKRALLYLLLSDPLQLELYRNFLKTCQEGYQACLKMDVYDRNIAEHAIRMGQALAPLNQLLMDLPNNSKSEISEDLSNRIIELLQTIAERCVLQNTQLDTDSLALMEFRLEDLPSEYKPAVQRLLNRLETLQKQLSRSPPLSVEEAYLIRLGFHTRKEAWRLSCCSRSDEASSTRGQYPFHYALRELGFALPKIDVLRTFIPLHLGPLELSTEEERAQVMQFLIQYCNHSCEEEAIDFAHTPQARRIVSHLSEMQFTKLVELAKNYFHETSLRMAKMSLMAGNLSIQDQRIVRFKPITGDFYLDRSNCIEELKALFPALETTQIQRALRSEEPILHFKVFLDSIQMARLMNLELPHLGSFHNTRVKEAYQTLTETNQSTLVRIAKDLLELTLEDVQILENIQQILGAHFPFPEELRKQLIQMMRANPKFTKALKDLVDQLVKVQTRFTSKLKKDTTEFFHSDPQSQNLVTHLFQHTPAESIEIVNRIINLLFLKVEALDIQIITDNMLISIFSLDALQELRHPRNLLAMRNSITTYSLPQQTLIRNGYIPMGTLNDLWNKVAWVAKDSPQDMTEIDHPNRAWNGGSCLVGYALPGLEMCEVEIPFPIDLSEFNPEKSKILFKLLGEACSKKSWEEADHWLQEKLPVDISADPLFRIAFLREARYFYRQMHRAISIAIAAIGNPDFAIDGLQRTSLIKKT